MRGSGSRRGTAKGRDHSFTARSTCVVHTLGCEGLPEWRFGLEHQQRHGAPSDRRSRAVQRLNTSPGQPVGRAHHTDLNEHGAERAGAKRANSMMSRALRGIFSYPLQGASPPPLKHIHIFNRTSARGGATRDAHAHSHSTNPAGSSTGWPLTPHSGSARVSSASALLRAPLCFCRAH